jgi:chorismate mutase / prephenate dehydrogenase
MTKSLDELRDRLDRIDRSLLEMIAERQAMVREIARVKHSTGFPLRDFQRERQVLEGAARHAAELGLSPTVADNLMRMLIRYSLTSQERDGMSAQRKGNGQRALVIGGGGKMGNWFALFLYSQGFEVEIADPRPGNSELICVDWKTSALAHDYIVVATPMSLTNSILLELAQRKPSGVIFDLASLKSPLRSGLKALCDAGLRVTSLHPMFGPDVELLAGRHVVFIDLSAGDALQRARALFNPTLAAQIVLDVDEHDRMMAYILGLSHAVNIAFFTAVARSGKRAPQLLEVSGTTFAAQFDVARRVSQENPELYYEIQTLNDYAEESLLALENAVANLGRAVRERDSQAFVSLMQAGHEYAGDRRTAARSYSNAKTD